MLAGTVPDLGHRYWGVSPGNRAVGVLFRQIVAKRSITMLFSVWDYSVLTIEIFSDVICPWCYIGKRRLDQVLNSPTGEGVEVRWRPFQLYPSVPLQGWDRAEFIRRRYGVDADPGRVPTRIDEEAKQILSNKTRIQGPYHCRISFAFFSTGRQPSGFRVNSDDKTLE